MALINCINFNFYEKALSLFIKREGVKIVDFSEINFYKIISGNENTTYFHYTGSIFINKLNGFVNKNIDENIINTYFGL